MNWRVALIAAAGVAAVALLVWLLQGEAPVEVQQDVLPVAEIPWASSLAGTASHPRPTTTVP